MMGGELAAGAAIAGNIVKHAGKDLSEETKAVNKKLLERATEKQGFDDGAEYYANRVAVKQAMLTNLFKPLARLLGVSNHYFKHDFDRELAEKLADVPDENIVAPKASMAANAMQQLGYSLDEPDLKDLYLSLLATASDDRRNDTAHPSFVEVIKQLSSDEVPVLNRVLTTDENYTPLISLQLMTAGQEGWQELAKHIVPFFDEMTGKPVVKPHIATYIDNWVRLGLIEVSYSRFLNDSNAYDWAEQRPELIEARAKWSSIEGKSVSFEKGYMGPTSFGAAFAKAVGITS